MPAVNLSPVFNDAVLDANGVPYVGAKVFTYAAGSTTKQNTYTSSAGSVAQSNPIVLNSRGEPTNGPIWLTDGSSYKFVLAAPTDSDPPSSPIRTIDNVSGVNDIAAAAQSEWVSSGLTPTYVSSSSFSLSGDQTTEFHVGRRLKITDGAGTDYAAISKSAFSAGVTTVTIDATTLTTPVSAVSLGINSAVNPSDPLASAAIISPCALTAFENLAIATTSVTAATITADKCVVRNSAGTAAVLSTVSLTVAITTAGANGLDTGAEAANTGYFLWVIWNGATVAGLLSASSTAPTLPSGYTHKGLVGSVFNDSGSNFLTMVQHDRYVQIAPVVALSNGQATSATSVSLSTAIPPNVWRALLNLDVTADDATNVYMTLYANAAASITILVTADGDSGYIARAPVLALLSVSQTVWYSLSGTTANGYISVVGYIW